jgi:hypothetical protein
MPPLGGPGPRRVNVGAVKRRQRNLARIPKVVPKSAGPPVFPRYVPPRPAAIPVRRPTATQLRQARAQEQGYKSQAGAVRRVAKTQAALGPGKAVRPEGRILRRRDIAPLAQEQAYKSLADAVSKIAQGKDIETAAHRKVKIGGLEIEAGRLSADPRMQKAIGLKAPGALEKAISSPKYAIKAISNIPADIGELAITTPTSIVHLGATAGGGLVKSAKTGSAKPTLKAGEEIGKEVIEPYKQLIKDPLKFATEHPVTTALMVAPTVKVPGLAAGRAARLEVKVAGRTIKKPMQTLERPAATLPGTTLNVRRTGSRDVFRRATESRRDVRNPSPTITTRGTARHPISELDRRVDEFYDRGQQKKQQMVGSAARDANQDYRHLPKKSAERRDAFESRLSGAVGSAHQHVERQFAQEFGSHWQVTPGGVVVELDRGPEGGGVIHADRAAAQKVADKIEHRGHFEPRVYEVEGATPGETSGFAVVPRQAAERFAQHKGGIGKAGWGVGPALRVSGRAFRKTVLPTSTKWLMGQAVEAGVRSAVHGGGPIPITRYVRGRKLLKAVEREHGKQVADELLQRTVSGGQFGITGPATEYARGARTLEQEFARSGLDPYAQTLSKAAQAPVVRHVRKAYRKYAETIFNDINGPIEAFYKTGMLGKAVKQSPLMERSVIGLSERAISDAAQGLHNTSAQVELGRAIDTAYGRYSKHSPVMRDAILHSTPFVPWLVNMGHFLTRVLPRDHPVKTALLADVNAADEQWRRAHRLSTRQKDHVPDFMLGSYPKGKKFVPAARYAPFLPGDWSGSLAGQAWPQVIGAIQNLAGVDWTGKELPGGQGRRVSNAALTEAEALIPGVSQADRITGLGAHYVRGQVRKPSVVQGKDIEQALLDVLNPVRPIGEPSRGKRKAKRVRAIPLGGAGRGVIPLSGGQAKIPL